MSNKWVDEEMESLHLKIYLPLVLIVLLGVTGCASRQQLIPLGADEQVQLHTYFVEMNQRQRQCADALDVDVSLTFKNLFYSGTIFGYLQAKVPSYLRFEGLNPLGMTESILTSNGTDFTFLAVRAQKAYQGRLGAVKLRKYLPDSAPSTLDYFWLSGRLALDDVILERVGGDPDGKGYWFNFSRGESAGKESVLVDLDNLLIKQRRLLSEAGEIAVDVTYEYQEREGAVTDESAYPVCTLPDRLTIHTDAAGSVTINFKDKYQITNMPADSVFTQKIPLAFERIVVK